MLKRIYCTSVSARWRMPDAVIIERNKRKNEGMKDTHSGFLISEKKLNLDIEYSLSYQSIISNL